MKISKEEKRIIHEALEAKYQSFYRSVYSLARDGILKGEMLKKLRIEVEKLHKLVRKYETKNRE